MASQAAELKMPQSGNVQREPSMEEILASIRRIIEDSDQVRKPEPEIEPRTRGQAAPLADVTAFRGELGGVAREEPALRGAVDDRSAEPQAKTDPLGTRMKSAPSDAGIGSAPLDAEMDEFSPAVEEPAAATAAELPEPRPEPEEETAEPVGTVDLAYDHLDDIDEDVPVPPQAANTDAAVHEEIGAAREEIGQPAEKPSIISEHTGRQVAAAFGELSQAFMASRQRSFDEMAAEMMRPMLQEWLDNNLPTIVEKLVREEIERVARGA